MTNGTVPASLDTTIPERLDLEPGQLVTGIYAEANRLDIPVARSGLQGRRHECEVLDQLMAGVRAGRSGVLVMRGEAGIGKSALLEFLAEHAADGRIARATGVESEMELAFAGLHQLCAPMLDHLDHLPGPQREALSTAFGLSEGGAPDRFLVALAVLSLLADVAEERPLACLVDDAQWLDQATAQVLAFVARRLLAEPIALVFAVRTGGQDQRFAGLPDLAVRGLGDADARALLEAALRSPLDEAVRDRIVAESHGNPLALLELPGSLTPAELAGGFGLPAMNSLASLIEQGFLRRLEPLPAEARQLLIMAAAEPTGDVPLLLRAAERIGIGPDAAAAAETAGLIDIGTRIRFRHPLVRSAIYRLASVQDRRDVHRALAEVTNPELDPDRRAWHRAHAAAGPDEATAAELEQSAGRAQARGGLAAAAAFLERAAALTPERPRRAARALAAAQAAHESGAPDMTLRLLAMAVAGPLDDLQSACADRLRAQATFTSGQCSVAVPLLLAAAKKLEPLDALLARDAYLEAFSAAMFLGRLSGKVGVREVAKGARGIPPSRLPRKGDTLLDGRAVLFTDGYQAAMPVSRRALQAFSREDTSCEDGLRWLWLASITAADLWEDEGWRILSTRHVRIARQAGALSELTLALNSRVFVHLFAGELTTAASLVDELRAVREVTGSDFAPYGALTLAALSGREHEVGDLIAAHMSEVARRGDGIWVNVSHWATAVLCNGLGRYEQALSAARQGCEDPPPEFGFFSWSLVELVEAAVRSGHPGLASDALERLGAMTRASGTDWALAMAARSRALLSKGDAAERLYREAIDRISRTTVRVELARSHLLYGEWLRRESRRVDARHQLRAAYRMLTAMGVEGFAERARRELVATGETLHRPNDGTREELTAQERQIAQLAADGRTNPEIGAELFISGRTVEWHLRKVYPKLGVGSRRELRHALDRWQPERQRGRRQLRFESDG